MVWVLELKILKFQGFWFWCLGLEILGLRAEVFGTTLGLKSLCFVSKP